MKHIKNDKTTTVEDLKQSMKTFVNERDWGQFHSPKNLAMAMAIEAGELMEHFQWVTTEESFKVLEDKKEEIENELADVVAYVLSMCNFYDIDLTEAFERKKKHNQEKYPVEKCSGKSTKYTEL